VRYGVNLDGMTQQSKHRSSIRRLLKPNFAHQLQRYAENMGVVKSAVSAWSVFFSDGQTAHSGSKNSPETTAVAMNVLTQIAMKVAVAYAQSVQRFYETASGLSVNLSSSTVTSKSQETPEESTIYGSLDESDERSDDDLDTITSLF
jgi:dihydroorotate dehydrogenase